MWNISIITESSVAQLLEFSGNTAWTRAGAAAAYFLGGISFGTVFPIEGIAVSILTDYTGRVLSKARKKPASCHNHSLFIVEEHTLAVLVCQSERMFTNIAFSWILSKPKASGGVGKEESTPGRHWASFIYYFGIPLSLEKQVLYVEACNSVTGVDSINNGG